MSSRSLNRVQLIGNLTRDVELRYTPQGTAVATIGLATNRSWTDGSGQKQEETEFHRLVAWAKLAELCSQLLFKGRKVYVEGRLQTRKWQGQDGQERYTTEIVINDMIILDNRRREGSDSYNQNMSDDMGDMGTDMNAMVDDEATDDNVDEEAPAEEEEEVKEEKKEKKGKKTEEKDDQKTDEVSADDIPF